MTILVNNMLQVLDVTAPKKQFRNLRVWERCYANRIRKAATSRNGVHRKALHEEFVIAMQYSICCNTKWKKMW